MAQPLSSTEKKTPPSSLLPGKFRDIGLERLNNEFNPEGWLAKLMGEPNYERFQRGLQSRLGKSLGPEFDIYRGLAEEEPLMQGLLGKGPMPNTTAITPDPSLAREFALYHPERLDTNLYVVGGKGTPEAIQGMVPQRGGTQKDILELLVNPQKTKNLRILDKYGAQETGVEGVKPVRTPRIKEVTQENLHQHLGVKPEQVDLVKRLIPFHEDTLFDESMRGMGPALIDRYTSGSELNRIIKEKLGYHPYPAVLAGGEFPKGPPEGLLSSKRGSAALNEIWKDWSTAGYGGTPNQVPQDRFMDTVLEALARATQSRSSNAQKHMFPYPAGVSGFRRSITPEEKMFGGGKHSPFPHDAQKSLDILEHLREYGFLEPGVLEEALKSTRGQAHRVLGQATPVDPAGLERIKRLLERVGR